MSSSVSVAAPPSVVPASSSPTKGEMTDELIRSICKSRKDLYDTVELNDVMFLNNHQFSSISSSLPSLLPASLSALYLDHNRITEIRYINSFSHLKSLYLQSNRISSLDGAFRGLSSLEFLNVSSNQLTSLRGLEELPQLISLDAGSNEIETLEGLEKCSRLRDLDLSNNRLSLVSSGSHCEAGAITEFPTQFFASLLNAPNLRVLYLHHNPLCQQLKSYRKHFLARLPGLAFLDDRPVSALDSRASREFFASGISGEREMRDQHQRDKQAKDQRNMELWKDHQTRYGNWTAKGQEEENLSDSESRIQLVRNEEKIGELDDESMKERLDRVKPVSYSAFHDSLKEGKLMEQEIQSQTDKRAAKEMVERVVRALETMGIDEDAAGLDELSPRVGLPLDLIDSIRSSSDALAIAIKDEPDISIAKELESDTGGSPDAVFDVLSSPSLDDLFDQIRQQLPSASADLSDEEEDEEVRPIEVNLAEHRVLDSEVPLSFAFAGEKPVDKADPAAEEGRNTLYKMLEEKRQLRKANYTPMAKAPAAVKSAQPTAASASAASDVDWQQLYGDETEWKRRDQNFQKKEKLLRDNQEEQESKGANEIYASASSTAPKRDSAPSKSSASASASTSSGVDSDGVMSLADLDSMIRSVRQQFYSELQIQSDGDDDQDN